MAYLVDDVELVLLCNASAEMVDDAIEAVADSTPYSEKLRTLFSQRRVAMINGELPEALWLLREGDRALGWCGWAPYLERSGCWQTTTYFSAEQRGTGLFERARCHQLHAADVVTEWLVSRDLPPATFVLSIADWNERSLRASRRYAVENGWPDTWEEVFEPLAGRLAHVFTIPQPAEHHCYRG